MPGVYYSDPRTHRWRDEEENQGKVAVKKRCLAVGLNSIGGFWKPE